MGSLHYARCYLSLIISLLRLPWRSGCNKLRIATNTSTIGCLSVQAIILPKGIGEVGEHVNGRIRATFDLISTCGVPGISRKIALRFFRTLAALVNMSTDVFDCNGACALTNISSHFSQSSSVSSTFVRKARGRYFALLHDA